MAAPNLEAIRGKYGLTEKQVKLAFAYVERGNLRDAAEVAAISYGEALRLMHEHPEWMKAVREVLNVALLDDMVRGRAIASNMMKEAKSEKIQLDAIKMLWDRAEGEPLKRTEQVGGGRDLEAIAAMIVRLAGELGLADRLPQHIMARRVENAKEVKSIGRDNETGEGEGTSGAA